MIKNRKKIVAFLTFFVVLIFIAGSFIKNKVIDIKADDKFEESKKLIEPYVEALKAKHPNWTFEYFNTGIEWSDVIREEMKISRSLVPYASDLTYIYQKDENGNDVLDEDGNKIIIDYVVNRYSSFFVKGVDTGSWYRTPTCWMSPEVNGAFNWEKNKWVLYSGTWVQASEEAVKYMVDPRNWITEENVFSFEKLSFNPNIHTYSVLKSIMEETFMDCDYAYVQGTDNKTYADVLLEAGEKYNISPIYLCSKILYEKGGAGIFDASSGRYSMNDILGTGVSTSDGKNFHKAESGEIAYYNMFNIQASGNKIEDIINNGGKEAADSKHNWTSQYLAIMGGAKIIAEKYVDESMKQNTLYFQKWAVSVPDGFKFWKQYQQAISAAVNEGWNNMDAYRKNNLLDSPFTFIIPVYYDMPLEPCPKPESRSYANPNYKLKDIQIKGIDISGKTSQLLLTPSFSMDTNSYDVIVPYTTAKIEVEAYAIAETSQVFGTGTYDLAVGNNTINIISKSEYGTEKTYTVNVYRAEGSTLLTELTPSVSKLNETFNKENFKYTVYVGNDVKTIKFDYKTESDIAVVKLRGTEDEALPTEAESEVLPTEAESEVLPTEAESPIEVLVSAGSIPEITLDEGDTTVYLDVYASEEDIENYSTYQIDVIRYTEVQVDWKELVVKDGMVSNFEIGDTVSNALTKLNVQFGSANIQNSEGNVKGTDDVIATGDIIKIYDVNGDEKQSYIIIIYGDINGDGKVDMFDAAAAKKHVWIRPYLKDYKYEAANVYRKSEGIDIMDMAVIKKYMWFNGKISQK